jgi:ribosomal protein L35AE/L33A
MAEVQKKEEASDSAGQPVRLYVKGAFITYRRGKNVIASPNHAIIQIDGVQDKDSAKFYFGTHTHTHTHEHIHTLLW